MAARIAFIITADADDEYRVKLAWRAPELASAITEINRVIRNHYKYGRDDEDKAAHDTLAIIKEVLSKLGDVWE